ASCKDNASAQTSAVYSPRLWPASTLGLAPPCSCHTRQTATPAASNAGCVFSVRFSASSGPCCDKAHRSMPAPAEASSNVALTAANSEANSASMPSDCEPCPGNTKARLDGEPAVDIGELSERAYIR